MAKNSKHGRHSAPKSGKAKAAALKTRRKTPPSERAGAIQARKGNPDKVRKKPTEIRYW